MRRLNRREFTAGLLSVGLTGSVSAQTLLPDTVPVGAVRLKIGGELIDVSVDQDIEVLEPDDFRDNARRIKVEICAQVDKSMLEGGSQAAMVLNETRELTTGSGRAWQNVLISKRDNLWMLKESASVDRDDYNLFHAYQGLSGRSRSRITARLHTSLITARGRQNSYDLPRENFFFSEPSRPKRTVYVSRLARFEATPVKNTISIESNYPANVRSIRYRLFFLNCVIPVREFSLTLGS